MEPVVKYPVYDLDSQLLVQEGTELTSDFMDDFCREKRRKHPFARLFDRSLTACLEFSFFSL